MIQNFLSQITPKNKKILNLLKIKMCEIIIIKYKDDQKS